MCFRLLDDRVGGYLDTRPMTPFQATRRYVPHTNVLETTFTTSSGVATLTDFMPLGRHPDAAPDDFIRVNTLPWLVKGLVCRDRDCLSKEPIDCWDQSHS